MSWVDLNWVDFAFLAIVAASAAVSLFRGFMREATSFAGLVAGLWAAFAFMDEVGDWFEPWIGNPSLRLGIGFVLVLVAVLVVAGILSRLFHLAVGAAGLTGIDRLLGVVFGAARGGLVAAALVLLAGGTGLPERDWWQDSALMPAFESVADEIRGLLPDDPFEYFDRAGGSFPHDISGEELVDEVKEGFE